MDRQDIDALLVGALYGELTPADEARLTAHLDSHPGDRGALDDLKSARAKVRESRIFELQAEPPQHVSALLLQEAHRRAPKKVVAEDGERRDSWFWRFARSFALHPAMAAAAMLIVVLGVSAIAVKNKSASFAPREAQPPAATQQETSETLAQAPSANDTTAAGSAAALDEGAAFHAGLAEEGDLARAQGGEAEKKNEKNEESASQRWRSANDGKVAAAPAKNKGIAVTTEQAQPKDLDNLRDERRAAESQLAKEQPERKKSAAKADSSAYGYDGTSDDNYGAPSTGADRGALAGAGGGGAANGIVVGGAAPGASPKGNVAAGPAAATPAPVTTTSPANRPYAQPPPPPPSADKASVAKQEPAKPTAPAAKSEAPSGATGSTVAKAPTASTATGTKTGSTTSTPTNDAKKVATQKPAEKSPPATAPAQQAQDPTVAWAKGQHASAVKLAKGGDCAGAAKLALTVSQKAPDYYASFMASDRQLKSCKAYIDAERDKEAEKSAKSRAQKRVNADEPAPSNESVK
ncbi:MAG TPA: hypothetical protein VMZ53_17230 [Kofleriaceae bacterium]|nr:hypothetical protein [Kofleriaceae bacterium]